MKEISTAWARVCVVAAPGQEVEPSLLTDGNVVTVNYVGLSVVAISAIQELYELVQEQQRDGTGASSRRG